MACVILAPGPGIEPGPWQSESTVVLATGPPGNSRGEGFFVNFIV